MLHYQIPHRLMFDAAAKGLEVQPNELLHIGDTESTDIDGARNVGAAAALFADDNTKHADSTWADYVFHTWDAFLSLAPSILGLTKYAKHEHVFYNEYDYSHFVF